MGSSNMPVLASSHADGEGGDGESRCQHDGREREAEGVAELSGFGQHVRYGEAAGVGDEDEEGQSEQDGVPNLRRPADALTVQ